MVKTVGKVILDFRSEACRRRVCTPFRAPQVPVPPSQLISELLDFRSRRHVLLPASCLITNHQSRVDFISSSARTRRRWDSLFAHGKLISRLGVSLPLATLHCSQLQPRTRQIHCVSDNDEDHPPCFHVTADGSGAQGCLRLARCHCTGSHNTTTDTDRRPECAVLADHFVDHEERAAASEAKQDAAREEVDEWEEADQRVFGLMEVSVDHKQVVRTHLLVHEPCSVTILKSTFPTFHRRHRKRASSGSVSPTLDS